MKVEIAFTTGPNDPSPVWVDVTQWLRANPGVSVTRGRQDQFSDVQPSKCTLTLDNTDGRFTPGNTASPYYPNVKKGRRIRVTATHATVAYRRFAGYVDEWPVTWADASATVAFTSISASSRQARLGRGTELRSIIEEEYLLDAPDAYYTMGEPEASVAAGNGSSVVQPPMTFAGSGASPVFGVATGPGTDNLTAVSFSGGKNLDVTFPASLVASTDTTFAYEMFFLTSSASFQNMGRLWSNTGDSVQFTISASGKLGANGFNNTGPIYFDLVSGATVSNGATHHALVRCTISAGVLTTTLFLDGTSVASTTYSPITAFSSMDRMTAGGMNSGTSLTGVISHMAVSSGTTEMTAARVLAHATAGLTGFSGERSDQRITRLAGYALVPAAEISTETGLSTSIVNQLTNEKTALSLMADVTGTESGVLFDARDGTLTFHARSHRYNAASAMTLSSELQANLEPRLDDQGLVNDLTTNREGGVTARAVDTASIADYGLYRETLTLLTTSDNEVTDAAYWKVGIGATPQVRIPVAEANLAQAGSAQTTALLTREIGDRLTLAPLPSQAPATSMDFFIEGYVETITPEIYRLAFNLSPAALSGVWQLDSSTYSLLGTTTRLGY
jgi:hypothetical protein